jgi:hypothetical protein
MVHPLVFSRPSSEVTADGSHDGTEMSAQAITWTACGIAAAVAVFATAAEWLRNRRRNIDAVGWVPWQLISVLAFFAAVGLAGLALHR